MKWTVLHHRSMLFLFIMILTTRAVLAQQPAAVANATMTTDAMTTESFTTMTTSDTTTTTESSTTTTTDTTTTTESSTTTTTGTTTTDSFTTTTTDSFTTTTTDSFTTTTTDTATTTTDSSATTTTDSTMTTTADSATTTTTSDGSTTIDSSASTTMVDILTVTRNSIQQLFNNPTNPTRLANPSRDVDIDDAISSANNNLNQLKITGEYPDEAQNLAQLLGFAKGLQMLRPYFTDLTMAQVSPEGQNATDLPITNSSINQLGVTDPTYKQILDELMASLNNPTPTYSTSTTTPVVYTSDLSSTTSAAAETTLGSMNDTSNSNNTSNNTGLPDGWSTPKEPLSLEAQRMLIRAMLARDNPNSMFPRAPTSTGNTASYVVIVRQNDVVVDGQYTLGGISPSTYNFVTCIYYDNNNAEMTRTVTEAKPGFCMVSDAATPGVTKLEIQVSGISAPPAGGYITVDGSYTPTRAISNYGDIFGSRNSEISTTMNVKSSNMPYDQMRIDENTGVLTWNIVPKRFDANSLVRLQRVVVQTVNTNIGTVTIVPYARQNGKIFQMDPISGQVNSPITGFPSDYKADILFFLVIISPMDSSSAIDPNQVTVTIDYCTAMENSNTSPMLSGIQPSYVPNAIDDSYNPVNHQTRAIYYSQLQHQQTVGQNSLLGPGGIQTNPSSIASCDQPHSLFFNSNSDDVAIQDNIWQINIVQTYGSPGLITTLQVDTQGDLVSGAVLLTLIDANQQEKGPYLAQMSSGGSLNFQNLPSTPTLFLQLKFPDGTQSNNYLVNIVLCPQTNVPVIATDPPVNQQRFAPAPSPIQTNSNNGQMSIPQETPYTSYVIQQGQRWPPPQPGQGNQQGQPAPPQPGQGNQQGQPWPPSQPGQGNQQGQPAPPPQPGQGNQQGQPWPPPQPGQGNQQGQPWPPKPGQDNQQGQLWPPPQLGQGNQQGQPAPPSQPGQGTQQGQPWPPPQPGQGDQQEQPAPPSQSGQGNQQGQPWPPSQPGQGDQQEQPAPSPQPGQDNQQGQRGPPPQPGQGNQQGQPAPLPQPGKGNQQGQPWTPPQPGQGNQQGQRGPPPQPGQGNQQGQPAPLPQPGQGNQQGQPWTPPKPGQGNQQGQRGPSPQPGQGNQQGQPWPPSQPGEDNQQGQPAPLPQPGEDNPQGQPWPPSQPEQGNQQGQPWQSGQTERSMGFYNGPNGRGPLPVAGVNNQNMYGQKPSLGQNKYNPTGQYPKNQYSTGQTALPITMQYTEEEVPCTLYLIRSGSRRIVANTANDQGVTWLLQVPSKPGYISVPNYISALKTSLSQLGVNYLNTDQSPASMPNGTALQFVSPSNMNDIGTFPEHLHAQILQVIIEGAPAPLPPPSLEIHMIICYEPISQVQPSQPGSPSEQTRQPGSPSEQARQPGSPYEQVRQPGSPYGQIRQPGSPYEQTRQPTYPYQRLPPQQPFPPYQPSPRPQPSPQQPSPQFPQPSPQGPQQPSPQFPQPSPQGPQQPSPQFPEPSPQEPQQPSPQFPEPSPQEPQQPSPQFPQPSPEGPQQPVPSYEPAPQPSEIQPVPEPQEPYGPAGQPAPVRTPYGQQGNQPSTIMEESPTTTTPTTTTTTVTTTTAETTTTTPGYCSCTCQCPYGAIQPQIEGATVNYEYLPPSQQQFGRRRRRSDTSYDSKIRRK